MGFLKMKLSRCQYRSECEKQSPIKRWLKNPKNKRPLIPPRDLEVDQVGAESFSGTATEEGVSEVVHFIRLLQKEPRTRDSPLPPTQKKSISSTGDGQASPCPTVAPGSYHAWLWFSNYHRAPALGGWALKTGCRICEGTAQLWDLFIQGH